MVIDLDDRFTRPMAGMAASTAVFRKSLDDSGRSVLAFDKTVSESGSSIDRLSGRLAILTRTAAALGPGLVPITTAMVPAIAGLTNQLAFAAAGAGTAVLAFNGLGDGLSALNAYQLEPSQANFEKMQEALKGLGPAAREFVGFLDTIGPKLQTFRMAAQEGMLPGVQEGLDLLLTRAPELRRIITEIADASGDLARSMGEGLASPRFDEFFTFLEAEARPALVTFGQTVGNLAGGMAELWMAMDPLSDDFASGLLRASESFERWAAGLSATEGFQDFLDYVRSTGPQVLDTIGSLASALIDIGTAVAPLGGPVLNIIEGFAKAISAVAESDIGTPLFAAASAMSALSLATKGFQTAMGSAAVGRVKTLATDMRTMGNVGVVAWGRSADEMARFDQAASRTRNTLTSMARGGAFLTGITLATTELGDEMGIANTASMALMGTMLGPWGTALGAAAGATMDLAASNNDLEASLKAANEAMNDGSVEALRAAIVRLKADMSDDGAMTGFLSGITGESQKKESALASLQAELRAAENASGGLAAVFGSSLGTALGSTARSFEVAAMSADEFRSSLAAVNALLSKRATYRDYQAALDDFTASVKENGRTFRVSTEAGRANQAALDGIASTALKVAESLKGADRLDFLSKARGQFIAAARDMGITRDRARNLANDLGLLEKKDPTVDFKERGADNVRGKAKGVKGGVESIPEAWLTTLNARDNASGTVSRLKSIYAGLPSQIVTNIITNHIDKFERQTRAEGGVIYGPGTGTSDSIPAMLSNGEYVIKAKAVEKYGVHMFDRLNAMRFAEGGSVRRGTDPVRPDRVDDRTPEELKKLREEIKADREERKKEREERRQAAKERRQTIRGAVDAFDLVPDEQTPGGEVRDAFKGLVETLRELKSKVPDTFETLRDKGARLADKIDAWGEKVENSRQKLADLTAERESLESSVRGTFNNDIFGNGVSGLMLQLQADTNDANARNAALGSILGMGINGQGDFFKSLAASGDLNTTQQLAAGGPGMIAQVEAMFNARAAAQNAGAGMAGEAAYGALVRRQEAVVDRQEQHILTLTARLEEVQRKAARDFEQAAERGTKKGAQEGAEKGTRDGMKDRDRETNQRARANR